MTPGAHDRRAAMPRMTDLEWWEFVSAGTRTGRLATTRRDGWLEGKPVVCARAESVLAVRDVAG
ncbi:MAG TPA: hypothetical protein VIJ51_01285 [Solirubrobacteraceae bacterium]